MSLFWCTSRTALPTVSTQTANKSTMRSPKSSRTAGDSWGSSYLKVHRESQKEREGEKRREKEEGERKRERRWMWVTKVQRERETGFVLVYIFLGFFQCMYSIEACRTSSTISAIFLIWIINYSLKTFFTFFCSIKLLIVILYFWIL